MCNSRYPYYPMPPIVNSFETVVRGISKVVDSSSSTAWLVTGRTSLLDHVSILFVKLILYCAEILAKVSLSQLPIVSTSSHEFGTP
jgi:hypothetical protein